MRQCVDRACSRPAQFVEALEGRLLLAVGTAPEYRGVNAMDIFNPQSSIADSKSWGVNIIRQTVMDFDVAPLNTGYIADKNLHGLQPIADQDTAAGAITIFCPFSWNGQQILQTVPSQNYYWSAYNNRLKDLANQFKDQQNVWLELWNEPYVWDKTTDPNQWYSDMKTMVDSIRSTGATNRIVVPTGQCGGNESVLIARGKDLVDADPLHNIIFDVHAYNAWFDSGQAGMEQRIDNILNAGVQFIFGEFGAGTPGGIYDVAPFLNAARKHRISALAWSWNAGDGSALLRPDGSLNDDQYNYNWGTQARNYLAGSSTVLPPGWLNTDIGAPALGGASGHANGTYTIRGGGTDIWNSSDQFQYAAAYVSGDNTITAHVASQTDSDYWAKSGVMFRDSTAAGAMFVALETTPSGFLLLQARTATGAEAVNITTLNATAPQWLQLQKVGNTFTAYTADTSGTPAAGDWALVGTISADFGTDAFLGGLAVTGHSASWTSTATFDNVALVTRTALPTGWSYADVGSPGKAGSATFNGLSYTVTGNGTDIWDYADSFGYTSAGVSGNQALIARVASLQKTDGWAKAGLMFRDSTAADSAFAAVEVTPSNGIHLQARRSAGAAAVDVGSATAVSPTWVKLIRSGSTFTAYWAGTTSTPTSADWTQFASVSGVSFASSTYRAGLAVTAHNNATTNAAVFSDVAIVAAPAVSSALVNGGGVQRSMVSGSTIAFSSPVTLGSGAFTLTRRSDSASVGLAASNPSGDGRTYVLSFSTSTGGSLADGIYDLVVHASAVRDAVGQSLPGDYTQTFHRLFGDVDGNRVVNALDYAKLKATYGRASTDPLFGSAFDYENNGVINALDLAQFRKRYGLIYSY